MRTIKIENCAQCPYSALGRKTSENAFLICKNNKAHANEIVYGIPALNSLSTEIAWGDPIPSWCPIPDTEVA